MGLTPDGVAVSLANPWLAVEPGRGVGGGGCLGGRVKGWLWEADARVRDFGASLRDIVTQLLVLPCGSPNTISEE